MGPTGRITCPIASELAEMITIRFPAAFGLHSSTASARDAIDGLSVAAWKSRQRRSIAVAMNHDGSGTVSIRDPGHTTRAT